MLKSTSYKVSSNTQKEPVPRLIEYMVSNKEFRITKPLRRLHCDLGVCKWRHCDDQELLLYAEDRCSSVIFAFPAHKPVSFQRIDAPATIKTDGENLVLTTDHETYIMSLPSYLKEYLAPHIKTKKLNKEESKMKNVIKKHYLELKAGDVITTERPGYCDCEVLLVKATGIHLKGRVSFWATLESILEEGYMDENYMVNVVEEVKYPVMKKVDDIVPGDFIELTNHGYTNTFKVIGSDKSVSPLKVHILGSSNCWLYRGQLPEEIKVVKHEEN